MYLVEKDALVVDDEYIQSVISILDHKYKDTYMEFEVYEVTAWGGISGVPVDYDILFKGEIKWDGCSHVWFGDDDGYLHVCGKPSWDLLQLSLAKTFDLAKHFIPRYDKDCAEL